MKKILPALINWLQTLFPTSPKIELTAQAFKLAEGSPRNIKLSWTPIPEATEYLIYRRSQSTRFNVLGRVNHDYSFDDYDVPSGPHTYQIMSIGGSAEISNEFTLDCPSTSQLEKFYLYDNNEPSTLKMPSKIRLGDTYYRYQVMRDVNAASQIMEYTSTDGYHFSNPRVVLTRKEFCAAGKLGFCKLESTTVHQHPETFEVIIWSHWEEKHGYGKGQVAVAYGRPGGQWEFGGSFRPLGYDSRDLTFFVDDDHTGYLISSTHTNSDMNIYRLSPDWHNVTSLVTTVLKRRSREAPSMVRHQGIYYLFTSVAAGWYPSPGQYISAKSLSGPWSESRSIGNMGGYAAQSGGVIKIGSSWVMCANRWSSFWKFPEPPNLQILLPIAFSNGYASYQFYPKLLYLDDESIGGAYGLQSGKIVPVIASSVETVKDHVRSDGSDGANNINSGSATPVPFDLTIDLGGAYKLDRIDLTTSLLRGSEAAYKFTIQTSSNKHGPFKTIVNHSNNTRVGFVTSTPSDQSRYQFVILKVKNVINAHNGHQEPRSGMYQLDLFGKN